MRQATLNPVTLREMRCWINKGSLSFGSLSHELSIQAWSVIGIVLALAAMLWLPFYYWQLIFTVLLSATLFNATLRGSEAFISERKQKMLSALKLTGLNAVEIVTGKIYSSVLAIIWEYGLVLIALCLWGYGYGIIWGLGVTVLIVGLMTMAASLSVLFSLNCDNPQIASVGAFVTIAFVFLCVPIIFKLEFFPAPAWVESWVTIPLRLFWIYKIPSLSIGLAALYVGIISLFVSLFTIHVAALQLRKARDEAQGESFWHRDLSRNWR